MQFYQEPARPWTRRCSGCLVLLMLVCLLAMCGAGIIYATIQPLADVSILDIQNVLASESELMLDLNCVAINPNIVAISVSDLDINVFAKSRHVGTDYYWRHHGGQEPGPAHPDQKNHFHPPFISGPHLSDGVGIEKAGHSGKYPYEDPWKEGHDGKYPYDDPERDPQTMLLGRIFHFDSPVTFDPSPLKHTLMNATGSLRLQKPGNKTETGGSERWEGVIQHSFQLIIRGIMKYQLPLDGSTVTASIGMSVTVDPSTAGVPVKGLEFNA